MKEKQFLELTTSDSPIIVGVTNIAYIEKNDAGGTSITLNFARGSDLYPKKLHVDESYEEVKAMLGFGDPSISVL